jgi:hypothetical protein
MLFGEVAENGKGIGACRGVGVTHDDERRRGFGDPAVGVGRIPRGAVVLEDAHPREIQCGQIRDEDELVRLRHERGEARLELRYRLVEHHNGSDGHKSSR